MIVPSMTVTEIHKEVYAEFKYMLKHVAPCVKAFKKLVLRSSRYPFSQSYEFKTREKQNLFIITVIAY